MKQAEIAKHLDLTSARKVRELRDRGVIPDPSEASLDEIRVSYIRHLRARAAGREGRVARSPVSAAESVLAFGMDRVENPKGTALADWPQLCELFELSDDDLRELVAFGCPFLEAGSLKTGRGWRFSVPHVMRWWGLWAACLDRNAFDGDEPARTTRRLRQEYPHLDETVLHRRGGGDR